MLPLLLPPAHSARSQYHVGFERIGIYCRGNIRNCASRAVAPAAAQCRSYQAHRQASAPLPIACATARQACTHTRKEGHCDEKSSFSTRVEFFLCAAQCRFFSVLILS
jgi:hypothetical protein